MEGYRSGKPTLEGYCLRFWPVRVHPRDMFKPMGIRICVHRGYDNVYFYHCWYCFVEDKRKTKFRCHVDGTGFDFKKVRVALVWLVFTLLTFPVTVHCKNLVMRFPRSATYSFQIIHLNFLLNLTVSIINRHFTKLILIYVLIEKIGFFTHFKGYHTKLHRIFCVISMLLFCVNLTCWDKNKGEIESKM